MLGCCNVSCGGSDNKSNSIKFFADILAADLPQDRGWHWEATPLKVSYARQDLYYGFHNLSSDHVHLAALVPHAFRASGLARRN